MVREKLAAASFFSHWLYPYRGVPRKHFNLHPGEICYRFSHRKQGLKPLSPQRMRQTAASEIKPMPVRPGQERPRLKESKRLIDE